MSCFDELPDDLKALLLLRYGEGLTYEEMSQMLGEKADTLQRRVSRALPRLRSRIEMRIGEPWREQDAPMVRYEGMKNSHPRLDLAGLAASPRRRKRDISVEDCEVRALPATSATAAATHGPDATGDAAPCPRGRGRNVILFLASNPHSSDPLSLSEECSEIQRELKMAANRDDFRFESRWAISVDEFMRHLTELDPAVLHFSGHGRKGSGLVFHDQQGLPQIVSASALAMMVTATARNLRVILLNACHSSTFAKELGNKVDCIVSMNGDINDEAARAFAMRFYGALANGRSVGNAVEHGVAALAAKQLSDKVLPKCVTRSGVDAHDVILTTRGHARRTRCPASASTSKD